MEEERGAIYGGGGAVGLERRWLLSVYIYPYRASNMYSTYLSIYACL